MPSLWSPRNPLPCQARNSISSSAALFGPGALAEFTFLQVARRRDMSKADCDAQIISPAFVVGAHGSGATMHIRTSWRSILDSARTLLGKLNGFVPEVVVRLCEVRTGPAANAHVHAGHVTFLVGSAT